MSMVHIAGSEATSFLDSTDAKCICPNAVDLRLTQAFKIRDYAFILDEDVRVHRGAEPVEPGPHGYLNLTPGSYEVILGGTVTIGPDEAGFVIPRSTLNRNGVFLTSGLYDSGYKGPMAACMHVNCGEFKVKLGTRLGQFVLFKAESLKQYDGSYGYDVNGNKKIQQEKFSY